MARQGRRAAGGEWVLGRRSGPFEVEGPTHYRPDLVLLVEAASGLVIASDVVHPEASADEVAALVEGQLEPGVSLRVDDEGIAEALRARLGPDQRVRVGPVPELRAPLAALSRSMGRGGRHRREEPLWTDEASPEARIGFFAAAASFERSAPWEAAGDGQVLRLDVPAFGWEGACASILGAGGEEFGLLLLRSLEDYVAFTRLAGEPRRPANRRRGTGIPLLSVNFDHPDDITGGHVLAKRARVQGWRPGPDGRLAYLLKVGPDNVAQPVTTDDYRLATASLEAVRVFVEKHRGLFERPPTEQVARRMRIAMPAGEVEVRLTAPPDDLPWAWGEEEPFDGLRRLENESVLEAFLEARRTRGASEEEVGHARDVLDEALRFKASRGEPGDRWTADEVEEYLLRHYPARGSAPDEDLERIPASLDAFLEWLGTLGTGRVVALRAARERLARCRERFLTDARDPRRFGPAKTLLRAMLREGVDPTDSRAVDAFMTEFNRRVEKDPSLLPLPTDLSPRGKTWVWTPDQPPPDPRGPCPCGSGRRYRKCCMPR